MNILVICHYGMYQNLQSSFVHAQAKAYAALGHRVRALVTVPVGKTDRSGRRFSPRVTVRKIDGVEVADLRTLSLSNYGKKGANAALAKSAAGRSLAKLFADFRPDVIHAHTLGADSDLGVYLKTKLGCPLVVTTHGSDTAIPYMQGQTDWLQARCAGADHIVAVSSALAGKVKACGADTPVSVILNGFSVENLVAKSWEDKKPMSLLQVGNLLAQKHVDTTVRAFRRILAAYPAATLTVVGQGPEEDSLRALCSELGVSDAVRFTGQLPNAAVLREMAEARIFCMPSVREGFGIVYLESMASGCLTVGTEGEGIADLIRSGENGFLVPPEDPDAIVRVVQWCAENPEQAAAVADRGRQSARSMSWERNARLHLELFSQILKEDKTQNDLY